ncbi:hypothetical protein BBD46_18680 [Natrialba sp. SSL1]|nr:hypothetical protein BBD46_18680 [Natrialba sp. SSL1]
MSQRPTQSPCGSDDRTTPSTLRSRRSVLYGGTTATIVAMAGCLDGQESSEDENGADDDDTDNGDDTSGEGDDSQQEELEDELFAVLDTYFEASAEGDLEAIDDVMHSLNPLNPAQWEEEDWEYQGGDGEVPSPFEGELVTADGTVDDVLELEDAAFWFQESDLETELNGEDIALVRADEEWLDAEAETLDGDGGAGAEDGEDTGAGVSHTFEEELGTVVWALVPEGDEWRILYMGAEDDTPEDPTELFEEEIIDDEQDVIAEIDWEYEQEGQTGATDEDQDDLFADVELARVVFTDEPGLEADAVRADSTIEGSHIEFGDTWSGAWATIGYHPDGDQIVVRIAQDGEETVVHREHYLPEGDDEGGSADS